MKKTKKRILSVLLSCAMALSLLPFGALAYGEEYNGYDPSAGNQQYVDVPTYHWAYQSINTCSQRSWFSGYPDGSFHPNAFIKRDEAAKVFVTALGLPWDKNAPVTYTDTQGSWAAGMIEAGKYLFPDTTNLAGTQSFRPSQTITREEAIYALVVACKYASKVETCDQSILNMFADQGSISAGVRPYVAVAVQENLMNGIPDQTQGTLIGAQKGLTRAEFATVLARALKKGLGPDITTAPTITVDPTSYSTITNQEAVTVKGQVTASTISDVTLKLDGTALSLDRDGKFSFTAKLLEGKNRFSLVASNRYGGTASQIVDIERNSAKAAIRVLSTIPTETTQSSISVNGKIDAYKNDCSFYLGDYKLPVKNDGYFEVTLPLKEGPNTFKLRVERLNVEESTQTISITRLTTAGMGEWLEALPAGVTKDNYKIEQKEQFQTRTLVPSPSGGTVAPSWSAWSAWKDGTAVKTETTQVQSRILYRFLTK